MLRFGTVCFVTNQYVLAFQKDISVIPVLYSKYIRTNKESDQAYSLTIFTRFQEGRDGLTLDQYIRENQLAELMIHLSKIYGCNYNFRPFEYKWETTVNNKLEKVAILLAVIMPIVESLNAITMEKDALKDSGTLLKDLFPITPQLIDLDDAEKYISIVEVMVINDAAYFLSRKTTPDHTKDEAIILMHIPKMNGTNSSLNREKILKDRLIVGNSKEEFEKLVLADYKDASMNNKTSSDHVAFKPQIKNEVIDKNKIKNECDDKNEVSSSNKDIAVTHSTDVIDVIDQKLKQKQRVEQEKEDNDKTFNTKDKKGILYRGSSSSEDDVVKDIKGRTVKKRDLITANDFLKSATVAQASDVTINSNIGSSKASDSKGKNKSKSKSKNKTNKIKN